MLGLKLKNYNEIVMKETTNNNLQSSFLGDFHKKFGFLFLFQPKKADLDENKYNSPKTRPNQFVDHSERQMRLILNIFPDKFILKAFYLSVIAALEDFAHNNTMFRILHFFQRCHFVSKL